MGARSSKLFAGTLTSGAENVFTSPAGKVTLLKSLYGVQGSGSAQYLIVEHRDFAGTLLSEVYRDVTLGSGQLAAVTLYVVLEPTEQLWIETSGSPSSWNIGAYGSILTA